MKGTMFRSNESATRAAAATARATSDPSPVECGRSRSRLNLREWA